ncbi:MAG: methyltransferase domain-containing protein [Acidimicrobiia bacterium]
MTWASDWWLSELERDPSYGNVVTPLLIEILDAQPGGTYLDLGCGEGQTMRVLVEAGMSVVGCDLDETLLPIAREIGPVVRCDLPDLSWLGDDTVDGAYASLVIEHLDDAAAMLLEAHRVVRSGGVLAVVVNHPMFAAPASGPIVDPDDGEVFWRWGRYLSGGRIVEPVGDSDITFYERPLADLLNMAADAGWVLEHMIERAIEQSGTVRQEEVPRLLAVRWGKR